MRGWILAGLCFLNGTLAYGQQERNYDVIITELLADPNPSAGLPEAEFIELKNRSRDTINLYGWIITDGNSRGRITEKVALSPDSFLIICSNAYKSSFEKFGNTIGISGFPSLDNGKDQLMLISADGRLIHGIEYDIDSFPDPVKANGGWSLEMIDDSKPCSGWKNWKFSTSPAGGTPGKRNAVAATFSDDIPLAVLFSYASDSLHVVVVFNRSLDSSLIAAAPSAFEIDSGIGQPQNLILLPPLFNTVVLQLSKPLIPDKIYSVTLNSVPDCYQSRSGTLQAKSGLAGGSHQGLVLNEILFNPRPSGLDFVEIYNSGTSIIDLGSLILAARNSSGTITGTIALTNEPRLIFPGDYILASENFEIIRSEYRTNDDALFLNIKNMPSWPDDKGTVILLNRSGGTIDEFVYSEKMHFPLLNNPEGVSLERIDPLGKTQDAGNWFSAASDAGYATPGRMNSQFKRSISTADEFSTDLTIFSPDGDGVDEQLTINYKLDQPGYSCSISIFNQAGVPVNSLVRNQVCGTEGYFRWNGLNDRNQLLHSGLYYLVIDLFHLNGKRKTIRKAVVLMYRS